MNQVIWAFVVQLGPASTGEMVFLSEGEAQAAHATWSQGYTVGPIYTDTRWVDTETGTIGGTPAATPPVIQTGTGVQNSQPSASPQPGSTTMWPAGGNGQVFRLILQTGSARFDTGATYQGCSRTTTNPCDPKQFGSLYDAVQYALRRGEIPYFARSVEEVWGIVDGTVAPSLVQVIEPSTVPPPASPAEGGGGFLSGIDPTILAVGAVAAVFLLRK